MRGSNTVTQKIVHYNNKFWFVQEEASTDRGVVVHLLDCPLSETKTIAFKEDVYPMLSKEDIKNNPYISDEVRAYVEKNDFQVISIGNKLGFVCSDCESVIRMIIDFEYVFTIPSIGNSPKQSKWLYCNCCDYSEYPSCLDNIKLKVY